MNTAVITRKADGTHSCVINRRDILHGIDDVELISCDVTVDGEALTDVTICFTGKVERR